jgi:hypothetical protein
MMVEQRATAILIDLGDMPSLAAAVTQVDPVGLVLWHPGGREPAGPRRLAMAQRHVELLEPMEFLVSDPHPAPVVRAVLADPDAGDELLEHAIILTQTARLARRLGCSRIVWPVQVGLEPDRVCQFVDCATTVVDLIDLASQSGAEGRAAGTIVIETPLIDLDDDQILDLADDAGAPLGLFWPCEEGTGEPCGLCPGCHRWQQAFTRAGIPWPWAWAEGEAEILKAES